LGEYPLPVVHHPIKLTMYHSAAAFTALYERTQLIVFRYIYALHGAPREDVEDLWVETYLRAWRRRYTFIGSEDAALGWLLKIARNLVFDARRRRHVEVFQLSEALPIAGEDLPEQQVIQAEQHQFLDRSLAVLSDQQREIVILRYVVGWRVNQIAAHFRMRENTVSVALQRALHKLAELKEKE